MSNALSVLHCCTQWAPTLVTACDMSRMTSLAWRGLLIVANPALHIPQDNLAHPQDGEQTLFSASRLYLSDVKTR